MRWMRDWLAWIATWTLVAQTSLWAWVGLDVVDERTDPTIGAEPVAAGLPTTAIVLSVTFPLAALLALAPRTRRVGLLLGGPTLLVAAWAFHAFPGTVGEWYVVLSAGAGLLALVGVAPGARAHAFGPKGPTRASTVLAGTSMVLAAVLLVWTCVLGGGYWQWTGTQRWTYGAGVAAGVVVALAGVSVPRWGRLESRTWRVVAALALAGPGLFLVLVAQVLAAELGGVLYRHEEFESVWDFGTPALLAGVGLVAAAVAALARRADLLALSVAGALGVGLLALWQESTWGRLMW